jgi:hypothetical protein
MQITRDEIIKKYNLVRNQKMMFTSDLRIGMSANDLIKQINIFSQNYSIPVDDITLEFETSYDSDYINAYLSGGRIRTDEEYEEYIRQLTESELRTQQYHKDANKRIEEFERREYLRLKKKFKKD